MESINNQQLIELAHEARKQAYAPYSGFYVGAALLTKYGKIYKGCNIENVSYSPTNCAERTAFFKAISEGEREFEAIAIVGGKVDESETLCVPCGVCRQVMLEFCNPKQFRVILQNEQGEIMEYALEQFIPMGFGAKS